jgi:site-specific recombinase XerD
MTNIHSHPTPLRQKFIEYLTLNRKAERTVHTYVSFIYSLAKHGRRSPDLLEPEDIRQWLYYLIAERKQAASTVNLAINAVRSFYGGLLQRDIEPLLRQIKRPRRPALAPRLYSMAEVEKLLTSRRRAAPPGGIQPPPPTSPLTSSARRSRFVQPAR